MALDKVKTNNPATHNLSDRLCLMLVMSDCSQVSLPIVLQDGKKERNTKHFTACKVM